MKKIIFVLLMLVSVAAFGQIPLGQGYTKSSLKYTYRAFGADSGFHVPYYLGTPSGVRTGVWNGSGNLGVDSTNGRFYFRNNNAWTRVANYSEIPAVIDTSNKWVNRIYRTPGVDSFYHQIGSTIYGVKDSTGGGGSTRFGVAGEDVTFTADREIDANGNDFTFGDIGQFWYWTRPNPGGKQTDTYVIYNGDILTNTVRNLSRTKSAEVTIDSTGDYGIGVLIQSATGTGSSILEVGEQKVILKLTNNPFYISRPGTDTVFTVASSGLVGIGTTTPDSLLTVELGLRSKRGVRFDGLPSGGVAADSVMVITSTGIVKKRDAASFGGSTAISSLTAATGTNSIDNGNYAQTWNWNTLSGTTGLQLLSNSTAGTTQTLFTAGLSGARVADSPTGIVADLSNTQTGATNTNITLRASASGGTINAAINAPTGNVVIGSTPSANDSSLTVELGIHGKRGVRFSGLPNGGVATDSVLVVTSTGDVKKRDAASFGGGGVTGSGTDNYIPRWNGTTALENSIIFDDATNVGVGTATPTIKLDVSGNIGVNDWDANGTPTSWDGSAGGMFVRQPDNTSGGGITVVPNANNLTKMTLSYAGLATNADFGFTALGGDSYWNVARTLFGSNTAATAIVQMVAGTTAASTAPLKFTTGTSLTTAEAGAIEYTTPQLFFTNGAAIRQELFQGQQSRVSTQFDKTSDVTLANITGLTANVAAGKIYRFEATLYTTSNVAGGVKAAIAGTATATNIIYEGLTTDAGVITQSRATALATAVGAVTAVTAGYIKITGTITVNAAGTLTVQFAQNASNGTASSVLVGSTFVVTEML